MTTSNDPQSFTKSPSAGLEAPQSDIPNMLSPDEKYNHLEDLLRQTLRLAGEISEELSREDPSRISAARAGYTQTSGECIVLRTTSRTASEPTFQLRRQSSTGKKHRKLRPSDDSEQNSTSPSAASSMQEPFSPGSLAMSLDAIVEGKRSDIPLVENSNFITDRLPESPPLTRVTTSQTHTSARSPPPGSTLSQDSMSESATSAPIPIPGPRRARPPASHRTSSPGLVGSGEGASSPAHRWHVCISPVFLHNEPEMSSSPPRSPIMPAYVRLEAVFPYCFFSSRHTAAHQNGEVPYIVIGKAPVKNEPNPPYMDECDHKIEPSIERSLHDFIEDWEGTVDELGATEERKSFHAL
ncbi:hypothetical protein N0V93_000871 [Gnomoniopsis smithogilvyi]|uniref:Uncharacterized protein n=1 Tax=Gnomoniopsis smithogilvyi TaxID=1191159 RepID=A0A9W9D244_9PEZI|nr:hypothetical protein N0V93_000871 [Gnomoniopsis smithogilvyi]